MGVGADDSDQQCPRAACTRMMKWRGFEAGAATSSNRALLVALRRSAARCAAVGDDLKQLLDAARAQGWTVTKTRGGHWKCVPVDPAAQIVIAPATTTRIENTRAALRRSGLDV